MQKNAFCDRFFSTPETRARTTAHARAMPSKSKSKSKSKKSKSAVAVKGTADAGADAPAKETEQDRDMTHAYAEDLKTDIYTDVNANPKALVHSREWRKIMNGAPRFVVSTRDETLDGRMDLRLKVRSNG